MAKNRGCGQNGGHFYSNLTQPVKLDCNFVVDSTNGNGLGLRALKSNGYIEQIFMNSSASITGTVATSAAQITSIAQGTSSLLVGMPVQGTGIPAGTVITAILSSGAVAISQTPTGNHSSESITYQGVTGDGFPSPNPAAGYAWVQFKNNFFKYIGGFTGFVSPPVISGLTSVTAGSVYQIATLGSTTLAQWLAVGVPPGLTPSANMSFIAYKTGSIGGSGTVYAPSVSGITSVEVIGDPNQSIANASIAANAGAWVLVQFLGATNSSTTTLIPTAPANNSVVGMSFFFDISSVNIDGL